MSAADAATPVRRAFPGRRQAVAVGERELFALAPLAEGSRAVCCSPSIDGLDAREWLRNSPRALQALLDAHGAVLLRGFAPLEAHGLGELAELHSGELRDYDNRSTPRTRVSGRVFTSTEYPADQSIPLHNEMSYTDSWPRLLFLCCLIPATTGGETPIADSASVYARIPATVRERFERHGVMYVRNFGHGMDLSWQEVFQTDRRADVDRYCREHAIEAEWLGGERLRTRHVVQASLASATDGGKVWFNQAHLFHVSSLGPDLEQSLREDFAEDELPRNAMYGDGSPLESEALAAVRAAYVAEEIATPWRAGDIVVVDNQQFAHGRRPYTGARSVLVAMT